MKQVHFLSDMICSDSRHTSAHFGSLFDFLSCLLLLLSPPIWWKNKKNSLWFFWLDNRNFNRMLDSVDLTSLALKKKNVPLYNRKKRVQDYKGFFPVPSFLFLWRQWFALMWPLTLLQLYASLNIHGENKQMKAFILKCWMKTLHSEWDFFYFF